MKIETAFFALAVGLVVTSGAQAQPGPQTPAGSAVPVTVGNFIRAESGMYLSAGALKEDGFGKFERHRELSPLDGKPSSV